VPLPASIAATDQNVAVGITPEDER
jgi:hypothetical protein